MRYATMIPLLLVLTACTVPDAVSENRKVRLTAESGEEGYGEALSEEKYEDFDDWWWDVYGKPAEVQFEVDRVTRYRGHAVVEYWIRVREWAPLGIYRFRAKVTLSYLFQPEEDIELLFTLRVPEHFSGGRSLMIRQEISRETKVVPVEIDTGG